MITENNLLLPARQPNEQMAEIAAPASKSISHRMLIEQGLRMEKQF